MGILNLSDVPPPFDDAPDSSPTGAPASRPANASAGSPASRPADPGPPPSRPAPGATTKTTATGAVIPSHVDGSAPPPAAPGAESSIFDTSALTGPDPASSASAPEPPSEPAAAVDADPVRTLELKPQIVEQLSTVYDPEIPVNIYELGLIYDIAVSRDGLAVIQMTLTAPGCPAAVTLPAEVQGKVKSIEGVSNARVDLVWDPPWDKDRMSDAAKLQLGIFD